MRLHLALKTKHPNRHQDALTSNRHISTAVPKVTSPAGSTAPATAQLALHPARKQDTAALTLTLPLDIGLAGVQRISVSRHNANWQSLLAMLTFRDNLVAAPSAAYKSSYICTALVFYKASDEKPIMTEMGFPGHPN